MEKAAEDESVIAHKQTQQDKDATVNKSAAAQDEIQQDKGATKKASTDSGTPLTIEQFRVLVGLPQDSSHIDSGNQDQSELKSNGQPFRPISGHALIKRSTIETSTRTKPRIVLLLRLLKRPAYARGLGRDQTVLQNQTCDEENEYPTSLYFALVQEENDQWSQYHVYNGLTYACLVLQLIIASVLIIVGAIPSMATENSTGQRITIAVLGAVTGLLTGILSLMKGHGLPIRLLQYASRLRTVRNDIEFKERILRSKTPGKYVTYEDVLKIKEDYESVLKERDMNRPDVWAVQTTREPDRPSVKR